MVKVETSTLVACFAADPGSEADLRAVERRAGAAGHRPAEAVGDCVIRTAGRGAW
jgi:hypothetical protein